MFVRTKFLSGPVEADGESFTTTPRLDSQLWRPREALLRLGEAGLRGAILKKFLKDDLKFSSSYVKPQGYRRKYFKGKMYRIPSKSVALLVAAWSLSSLPAAAEDSWFDRPAGSYQAKLEEVKFNAYVLPYVFSSGIEANSYPDTVFGPQQKATVTNLSDAGQFAFAYRPDGPASLTETYLVSVFDSQGRVPSTVEKFRIESLKGDLITEFYPRRINNAGTIVGQNYNAAGYWHGAYLKGTDFVELKPQSSSATPVRILTGINDLGVITGRSQPVTGAPRWEGVVRFIDPSNSSNPPFSAVPQRETLRNPNLLNQIPGSLNRSYFEPQRLNGLPFNALRNVLAPFPNVPGETEFKIEAINDFGVAVGAGRLASSGGRNFYAYNLAKGELKKIMNWTGGTRPTSFASEEVYRNYFSDESFRGESRILDFNNLGIAVGLAEVRPQNSPPFDQTYSDGWASQTNGPRRFGIGLSEAVINPNPPFSLTVVRGLSVNSSGMILAEVKTHHSAPAKLAVLVPKRPFTCKFDLNGDGQVTMDDAEFVAKLIGVKAPSADFNRNGTVDRDDASLINGAVKSREACL